MKKKGMTKKVTMGVMCVIISASMLMGCSDKSSTTEQATIVEESVVEDMTAPSGEKSDGEEQTEMGTEAPTEMETQAPKGIEDAFMGKINSIDGDTIMIDLYEVPQAGADREKPEGEAPTEMGTEAPSGEAPEGNAPEGAQDRKGQAPDGKGNGPQGQKPDDNGNGSQGRKPRFTLSGEAMTITVTDTTVITSKAGDSEETITLDDLAEGDTVTFTVDGEDALTIMVTPAQS